MNTQRAAAGIGAFLVLVIGTTLCVVTAPYSEKLSAAPAGAVTLSACASSLQAIQPIRKLSASWLGVSWGNRCAFNASISSGMW